MIKRKISKINETYVIDVGNNRHVTNVFDFVHLTTHVVDGKLNHGGRLFFLCLNY